MRGILVILDKEMNEIDKISLLKASFKPELISAKSEELYGESEPCIIYETACRNKLGMEMAEYLEVAEISPETIFSVEEDSEFTLQLDFPPKALYFKFQ